jgi:epoxyqueuosine reductase
MVADTAWIVERANALGFDLCGVVRAEQFPELEQFTDWLELGYGGEMAYLQDARRRAPETVMADLRSVIVCALNYNTAPPYSTVTAASRNSDEPRGWISRYAWGDDYHEVLWHKLNALVAALREEIAEPFSARAYADTGPVAERVFAKHAGLGWLGKNTLLLNKKLGSWFFLGVIFTSLDLTPSVVSADAAPRDLCGSCRRCLDACPTDALVKPYVMDARRCISYLTIELRGVIPEEFREGIGWQVYGCDICQDVCPYNRAAPVTEMKAFEPRTCHSEQSKESALSENAVEKQIHRAKLARWRRDPRANTALGMTGSKIHQNNERSAGTHPQESLLLPRLEWLAEMSQEEFRKVFRGSAMKRTKWAGLVRNACIALGNSGIRASDEGFARIVSLLRRLTASENLGITESARWALSRIEGSGE